MSENGNSIKILAFEAENVKRIRAVAMTPAESGLTIIGGRNGAGKTSVLDAIAWTLGGAKMAPSNPARDGAVSTPLTRVQLSNGLLVERKGKNGSLRVTDPQGVKGGQQILDALIGTFALDLPAFLHSSPREKAQALLRAVGRADEIEALQAKEKGLYDERTVLGRQAEARTQYARELPSYPGAPDQPVDVHELMGQHERAVQHNAKVAGAAAAVDAAARRVADAERRVDELHAQLVAAEQALVEARQEHSAVRLTATLAQPVDVTAIRAQLTQAEDVNKQVAANRAKRAAEAEAAELRGQVDALTREIESVRRARAGLLEGANLPLPGLTVEHGELLYHGQPWDCMSGAEQLRVAAAITRRLNPACGFILLDRLEQMDLDTLREFATWARDEHLQIIATRVSTGTECTLVIEDGCGVDAKAETRG